jgi:flavodoxin I
MQKLSLKDKKVAVFGLGDSSSYSDYYCDAAGEIHDVFQKLGANMLGYTSQEGYEHQASEAIRGDLFCGLLLDAINQEELTKGRVEAWVKQLIKEGVLE